MRPFKWNSEGIDEVEYCDMEREGIDLTGCPEGEATYLTPAAGKQRGLLCIIH